MRIIAAAAVLLLAGCATTPVVDAPTALNGRELDTALNLYGPWDERVVLNGKPHYVWRRGVVLNGQTYVCELRAEVAYRNTIRASIVEGYPAACGLFSVQYTATPERPPAQALPPANPAVIASRCKNCRPVGSPAQSASASRDARGAAERPPGSRAGRGGS
jgi:hypothetical protein